MDGADAGRTIEVWWGTGSPLVKVAGVREKGITGAGEAIDTTNDDSSGWRTLLDKAGVNSVSVPVSGVLVDDTLRADWFSGAGTAGRRMQSMELRYPDGGIVAGTFYLQEYTETGVHDDAITFEATFESSGAVIYTAAP